MLAPLAKVSAQAPTTPPTTPQTPLPTGPLPAKQPPPPPPATAVAANVNGQDIPELAVYRAFMHDYNSYNPENRKDLINHLVDNMLVDQYLSQLKIAVDQVEIEGRFKSIEAEATKSKGTLKEMLAKMHLTEEDLRKELLGALRWEKFVQQQAKEPILKDMFEKNPTMFDGTMVAARHILIPNQGQPSIDHLNKMKKIIEDFVAGEVAKLPATADADAKQKEFQGVLIKTFAHYAEIQSTCPSKKKGGELGEFPRVGAMVEPFAKTAFALKPYQISEPVLTEFGYHLILCTGIRPGRKDVKFDEVKMMVQDVYAERLREAVIAAYKPRSKITVNEAPK